MKPTAPVNFDRKKAITVKRSFGTFQYFQLELFTASNYSSIASGPVGSLLRLNKNGEAQSK